MVSSSCSGRCGAGRHRTGFAWHREGRHWILPVYQTPTGTQKTQGKAAARAVAQKCLPLRVEQPWDKVQKRRGNVSLEPWSSPEQCTGHIQRTCPAQILRISLYSHYSTEKAVLLLQEPHEVQGTQSSPSCITTEVTVILSQLPVLEKSSSQNCRCNQTSSNHHLSRTYSTAHFFFF